MSHTSTALERLFIFAAKVRLTSWKKMLIKKSFFLTFFFLETNSCRSQTVLLTKVYLQRHMAVQKHSHVNQTNRQRK